MPTNQPTPVILSDEQVAKVEAHLRKLQATGEPWESKTEKVDTFKNVAAQHALALCATVRALRQAQQPTRQVLETYLNDGEQSPPGLHDLAHIVTERLHSENTALREQLAKAQDLLQLAEHASREYQRQAEAIVDEIGKERDDLCDQLAQVKAESDERHDLLSAERRANDELRTERSRMLGALGRAQQDRRDAESRLAEVEKELGDAKSGLRTQRLRKRCDQP